MTAPYRHAPTLDLDRERMLHAVRGAVIAIAAVASWPIVDVITALVMDRIVGPTGAIPPASVRVAFVVGGRLVPTAIAIAIIHVSSSRPRWPRTVGAAWIAFTVLCGASLVSTHEALEISRRTTERMIGNSASAWARDAETLWRVEAFAGPVALLMVVAYCIARWQRVRADLAKTPSACPHCGKQL